MEAWIDSCRKPSLRILELGCGDTYIVSQLSQNTGIATYCGIDLSSMALSFAAQNLSHKVDKLDLHEGDM
ncbi:MAG: class I SAM-dependent methyltransferase [Gammaproteobacteria bacterium]|nr:class I SAM-dependent methyltransferase [Gammaproteobacteria bacterium]